MKKYFIYFMIYSFLGFVLERIINLIFLGEYYDNSIMVGPYQPLYGVGLILAIIIYDIFLRTIDNKLLSYSLLTIVAIATTAFSEFIHGEGYYYFQEIKLWDYGAIFTCSYPYVCFVPTTLFGIISALTIIFFHPALKLIVANIPSFFRKWIFRGLLFIFIIDGIYTLLFRLIEITEQ